MLGTTYLQLKAEPRKLIAPDTTMFMSGSCFADEIYHRARQYGLIAGFDPHGILFNPLSMVRGLQRLCENLSYTREDLFCDQDIFHSFNHHSDYSGMDADKVLHKIQTTFLAARESLLSAQVLIITFGSAYHYVHKASGETVSNCHKRPASEFEKQLADIESMQTLWMAWLRYFTQLNPQCHVVFTVSPVRHVKDGLIENNRSKARLLELTHSLVQDCSFATYFPSYEWLIDVLRDYRWYAADKVHPSQEAVDMIWTAFGRNYCTEAGLLYLEEMHEIRSRILHRIRFPDSKAGRAFLIRLDADKEKLTNKYPHLRATDAWQTGI
jgi:hypothetical protein